MPDLSGQIIKGYELQDRIGEGGFGAVYRAVQTAVGREVAIKVILPQYANQPDFIRRFEAEARLVARLEHPYIVSLYDYWRDPSGAYLVLRWLRGGTLRERLRSQGALPAHEAARLLTQIAAALTVAHRANIIHRDIKPANILLDGEGNAYLSDFGIALDTMSSSQSTTPSTDRQLVGSAGYISPEQIKVEDVSPLSDIYSLAIVTWELLAGHHPYADARTSIALFIKHSNEPLPPLPDYPASISAVLQKAAAKKPAERYQNVNEFAQAFRRAILEASLPDALDIPEGLYAEDYDTSSMARTVEFGPAEIKNPYKGLQAFQEGDAADFFGREALTRQLLQRLSEDSAYARFLAVVGPSGSGKSSVVKAGLLPALRRGELPNSQRWFIVEMLPGADPLTELQDALQSVAVQPVPNVLPLLLASPQALNEVINAILPPRSELVLVIDQFEEVFTQGNSQQRVAFLENLYEAIVAPASRLRVILTLRADFYDRPLLVGKFSTLIQQRTEVVLPLTVDELERAITAPARQVKVFFQQGLAAQIVSEVNDQPGVLPMLQYALTELFERREGQLLTSAAYQAIGGVLGALARRAEELYQGFDEAEQEAARQLFLRLVTLGEGTEDTRRRALESEILTVAPDLAVMQRVIRAFGGFRLLTFDRDPVSRTPTLEVAHEALIREWRRLRQWLDISRADVRLQRLLSAAAHDWEANARDPSFLLRGGRLVQFEDWFRTTSIALAPLDVTFVQASIAQRQTEEEAEAERLRKERDLERRARQRLGVLVIVLLLAFTGGVILSIAIFNQSLEAQAARAEALEQADTAVAAQNLAITQERRAQAEADNNATQVALVSTAQADAQDQANLAATAQVNAEKQAQLAATAQNVAEREASSNATQVALVSTAQAEAQNQAQVAAIAQNVAEREAQISQSLALAASASGILEQNSPLALALALQANAVENPSLQAERLLISAVLAAPRKRLDGSQPFTTLASYPGAGLRVVSGDLEGQLILWDVAAGTALARWTAHAGAVGQTAISADGRWIASVGGGERAVRVWEQRGDAWQERLSLPTSSSATALAFSDDGARLASGDSGGNVILWDTSTWTALQTLPRVSLNAVTSLAYRGGRRDLLVAFEDTLRLWDVAAQRYREFSSELPRVRAVAANREGTAFLSGGARGDGVPVLYDARLNVLANLPDHQGPVNSVAFSPDGRYTLSASDDFSVIVADSLNGALVRRFAGHNSRAVGAVFSADSRQVVTAGADAALYLWDIVTSTGEDRPYQGQRSSISYLGFDEAGRLLAAADDGRLLTWDEKNQPVAERRLLTPTIPQVRYARDGQGRLWLASTDVRRIEPDSTRSLWRVTPSENRAFISDLALSGDGRLLAWGGGCFFRQRLADFTQIGLLQVLDADTGQLVQSFDVAPPVDEDGQTVIQEGTNLGVSAVALSADGALLAAGFQDGRIGLYSVASGALLRTLSGHSAQVNDLAFSADADRLLSGSQDRALILWEVANGQLLRRLVGHSDAVNAVAFSPLDSTVLSGSEDRTLRLWDTETGEQIQFFGEQDVPISAAIYAPDGRSAVLGTIDGRVVQTPINTAASLRLWAANNRYIPELTCAQREQYRVLPLCDERANR